MFDWAADMSSIASWILLLPLLLCAISSFYAFLLLLDVSSWLQFKIYLKVTCYNFTVEWRPCSWPLLWL